MVRVKPETVIAQKRLLAGTAWRRGFAKTSKTYPHKSQSGKMKGHSTHHAAFAL